MIRPAAPNKVKRLQAILLRDYQIEVVNKCTGRTGRLDHPDAGLYYTIGLYVPEPIIMSALESMQDARLRNLNGQQQTINNLGAYYAATVRRMCADAGVETPIRWGGHDN